MQFCNRERERLQKLNTKGNFKPKFNLKFCDHSRTVCVEAILKERRGEEDYKSWLQSKTWSRGRGGACNFLSPQVQTLNPLNRCKE